VLSGRHIAKLKAGSGARTMVDQTVLPWRLQGGGCKFDILCPKYFAGMLKQSLTGWQIEPVEGTVEICISLHKQNDDYVVDARISEKVCRCDCLINALNEFLVFLAYSFQNQTDSGDLIHCAGFCEDQLNHIVVGPKNSGKSTLAHDKAMAGLSVYADDLLFWNTKAGEFVALGLPLRLRRPVVLSSGENADPSNFFAGSVLAYSKVGVFDIAPIGSAFSLDRLWEMTLNHQLKPVSLLATPKALQVFRIPKDFSTVKKQKLEIS
jgi:hypothetical protein